MAKQPTELLKGTLDLLILKTLALEPRHGVGVADRIAQITAGTFQVKPGSLFPALHRLEQEGFIAGEWGTTAEGHRAKYYRMTAAGQRQLAAEKKNWARIVVAIDRVLETD
jgi:transcriptional regulator